MRKNMIPLDIDHPAMLSGCLFKALSIGNKYLRRIKYVFKVGEGPGGRAQGGIRANWLKGRRELLGNMFVFVYNRIEYFVNSMFFFS